MADNIQFRVDAVLGDTSQLESGLRNFQNQFRSALQLNINNRDALNRINEVQRRIDNLRTSMQNLNLNINSGGVGGGNSGGNSLQRVNLSNAVIEANQQFSISQSMIDNIQQSVNKINSEIDGTVSRIRLCTNEQNQITGGIATITNGYTTWNRELTAVTDKQGQIIQGQFNLSSAGTTILNNQKEHNQLYQRAVSLINQIGQAEKQQVGTTGSVNSAYQQKINYLNQQLMTIMQQDSFNDSLTADEREQITILAQKLQLERDIVQARATDKQQSQQQAEMYRQQQSLIQQINQTERQQVGTTGQVNSAYQQKLNYLNQQLNALQQQDDRERILSSEQKQQLANLQQELKYELDIVNAKQRQSQQDALNRLGINTGIGIDTTAVRDIQSLENALSKTSLSWNANVSSIKDFKQETDSAGNIITKFTIRQKDVKNGVEYWKDTSYAVNSAEGQLRQYNQTQNTVNNSQMNFATMLKSSIERFVTWGIAMKIWTSVGNAINDCITYVKELDTAMTDIQMVTMATDSEIQKMSNTYNEMAKNLGRTTLDVAESATDWLRQGFSEADTELLIEDSMKLSTLGAIDSAEATKALTSTMKGYKLEAEEMIGVVDKLTAVDMECATSAGDLATMLARCANIARTSGIEFDQLVGILATTQEVTQMSAESVGNTYKTIFSRMENIKLGKLADPESGEALNDVETVLNTIGIKLRENNNTWRDFGDVLDEVGQKWQKGEFSDTEKSGLATAFAGTRQKEQFTTLMENYSNVQEYANIASKALGTANEKYEVYMDSVQAKQNQLTANFQEFYNNILNSGLITGLLDIGKALMSIMNIGDGLIGKIMLMITVFSALNIVLKSNALSSFREMLMGVGRSLKTVIMAIPNLITGLKGAKTAQDAFNVSASMNPYIAIAEIAIVAIMGIKMAIDAHNQAIEESIDKANELTEAYKSAKEEFTDNMQSLTETTSLKNNGKEYKDLQQEFDELCKGVDAYGNNLSLTADEYDRYKTICEQIVGLNPDLMKGYDSETKAIGNKNDALSKTIELLETQARLEAQKYADNSDDIFEGAKNTYNATVNQAELVLSDTEWKLGSGALSAYINNTKSEITRINAEITEKINNETLPVGTQLIDINVLEEMQSQSIDDIIASWDSYKSRLQSIITTISGSANISLNNKTTITQWIQGFIDDVENNTTIINDAKEELSHSMDTVYEAVLSSSEQYAKLDANTQKYLTEWATNNFTIDENTTEEQIDANKKAIENMINQVATSDYNSGLQLNNGNIAIGQQIFTKLFEIDENADELTVEEYRKQIEEVLRHIVAMTKGIEPEDVTEKQIVDMGSLFGFKMIADDKEGISWDESDLENALEGATQSLRDEIQAKIDSGEYTQEDVEIMIKAKASIDGDTDITGIDAIIANAKTEVVDATEVFSGYVSELDALSEQYKVLADAQAEYNKYGNITATTMKSIIDNGLLEYLTVENGQLQFNTQALQDNATAKQNDAIASLQSALFTDLQSIALGTYQEALDATNSGNANSQLQAFQTELSNTTNQALTTAGAISALNASLGTDYKFSKEQKAQADAVVANYNSMVSKVNSLSANLYSNYTSGRGSGGQKSSGGSSSKSEKEWWEKQLDSLKDKLDYNEITMNTYINSLENLLGKVKKGSEAWKKINKELQEAKLDNIENQFDRGEITIDTYIEKLIQLRKSYKKNTEEYKELTQTINESKADKWADQYERGQISLNKYVKNLVNLRNTYKKNSEAWKEYNDLINETKADAYADQYERGEISANNYIKKLEALRKTVKKGSEKYKEYTDLINDTKFDKAEEYIDSLTKKIDNINDKISQLGDVNTAKEQKAYAKYLSQQYAQVQSNLSKIAKILKNNKLTDEEREAYQEEYNRLLEEEVDIRDEIEDSVRDYYEGQKEYLEQEAELTKKQTLYRKEVEIYGKQGKELYEYYTNKEIEALEAKQQALDKVNEREELENDLLEARLKLQNALNNKTTKILTKQDDGTWAYTFSANMSDVKEAQEEIKSAEKAIKDYEIQEQIDKKKEEKESKASRYEDAEFWAEREYEQTINSIEKAYGDIDSLVEEWMGTYGTSSGKLTKAYQKLTVSNSALEEAITNLGIAINAKYETVGNNGTIKPKSFDTGGEIRGTGLIFAHDKERVLTQEQNSNFIKLLDNIDTFNKLIDISKISVPNFSNSNRDVNSKFGNQVMINGVTCNFPNITTTDGLRDAILSLPRLAMQQSKTQHK
jgi:TP901 family phage tail tape measure protein